MFREWGFLLSEIWGLLALAALVGLIAGWLIWARRQKTRPEPSAAATPDQAEVNRLRADHAACTNKCRSLAERIDQLERELTAAKMRAEDAEAKGATPVAAKLIIVPPAPLNGAPLAALSPAQRKPDGLSAARGGMPDDLKLIKGIGPALEALCNRLGFYHFDQLANWTAEEVAWVDENLEGFKGRVTRDNWVAQARDLAAGKPARAPEKH
ncbi:MAG: NADH-quinone oxidoreductase subunit E [Cypionkella sp.]|nr:NADH-quinone oxidoreductase subunit E [Cypionkella sp.]